MTDKDAEHADYLRRKAERKEWTEWTETDLWGNRIFPCSNIFRTDNSDRTAAIAERKRIHF